MTRKIIKTTAASAVLLVALGTTAAFAGTLPDNFAAIDANADGQVTYKEYAAKSGVSKTASAQQFIKISNGNQFFTEGDLLTAVAMQDQPNWGQTNYVGATDYGQTSQPYVQPNTEVLSSGSTGGNVYGGETTTTEQTTTYETSPVVQPDTTYSSDTTSGAYTEPETYVEPEPAQDYIEPAAPDIQYNSDTTSGAYTEPETYVEPEPVQEYIEPAAPETKVWNESGESGAAAPTPAPVADPIVEPVIEPEISTESATDMDVESRPVTPLDDAEGTISETLSDAEDMATDVMEDAQDAVTPDE